MWSEIGEGGEGVKYRIIREIIKKRKPGEEKKKQLSVERERGRRKRARRGYRIIREIEKKEKEEKRRKNKCEKGKERKGEERRRSTVKSEVAYQGENDDESDQELCDEHFHEFIEVVVECAHDNVDNLGGKLVEKGKNKRKEKKRKEKKRKEGEGKKVQIK